MCYCMFPANGGWCRVVPIACKSLHNIYPPKGGTWLHCPPALLCQNWCVLMPFSPFPHHFLFLMLPISHGPVPLHHGRCLSRCVSRGPKDLHEEFLSCSGMLHHGHRYWDATATVGCIRGFLHACIMGFLGGLPPPPCPSNAYAQATLDVGFVNFCTIDFGGAFFISFYGVPCVLPGTLVLRSTKFIFLCQGSAVGQEGVCSVFCLLVFRMEHRVYMCITQLAACKQRPCPSNTRGWFRQFLIISCCLDKGG